MNFFRCVLFIAMTWTGVAAAAPLQTNSTQSVDVPAWVTKNRIDKVTDRVQYFLEWTIRRVTVVWYQDQASFERAHGLGSTVMAVAKRNDNQVLMGPKITSDNFDAIFGHELVHVILYQKYKEAVPKWLEEGLANHVVNARKVDYRMLASQPPPEDVRQLVHPFRASPLSAPYHYAASQALVEMIAAKCDLKNLLRMSVGRKLDDYLGNLCRITDLNQDFRKWIKTRS
ncbi:MAG: hypothetical protein ACXWC9_01135 [Pseudobdellovibrionaceae bacterium]